MRSKKSYFPYEWLDDYDKLNESKLPEYDFWYSSLKNKMFQWMIIMKQLKSLINIILKICLIM